MDLQLVKDDIWTYEGEIVSFYGYPYTTRMTVIRLKGDKLWIHSPEKLTADLQTSLHKLGEVSYLISPNHLHHLYLDEWLEAYPGVINFAAPGLIKKRRDIHFDEELTDIANKAWENEILQLVFRGSFAMQEVVFFHVPSKTLLLTDLIENFPTDHFQGWQRYVAKFAGILAPDGKAPIDFRFSFIFGRHKARQALAVMRGWQPENIIISHGNCIYGKGMEFMERSFAWLN